MDAPDDSSLRNVDGYGIRVLAVDVENDRYLALPFQARRNLYVELIQTGKLGLVAGEQHCSGHTTHRAADVREGSALADTGSVERHIHRVGCRSQADRDARTSRTA